MGVSRRYPGNQTICRRKGKTRRLSKRTGRSTQISDCIEDGVRNNLDHFNLWMLNLIAQPTQNTLIRPGSIVLNELRSYPNFGQLTIRPANFNSALRDSHTLFKQQDIGE